MTNYQKWLSYTEGLPSPDNMRLFGWTSLIASALQRRVWLPPDHERIYPSNYTIFVSEPGIGKSLIIKRVSKLIRYWKRGDNVSLIEAKFNNKGLKETASVIQEADALKEDGKKRTPDVNEEIIKPSLFPIAADASTYEALVLAFGKCYRRIQYVTKSLEGKEGIGTHGHASLCATLEELGSLLRKRTHDTVTFLLGLYDCPEDYEYDTVSREKDRIRRGCLNILAGTNPSFMMDIFSEKLINTAFLSRTLFIFATKNRKAVSRIPELSDTEKQFEKDILSHILKLSTLYGCCYVDPETDKWIDDWFIEHETHPENRSSRNPKLRHYYSRKLIHMKKLATALHFGESTDMHIPLPCFQHAVDILNKEEKSMHLALTLDAHNDQAKMIRKISECLTEGPRNFVEICILMFEQLGIADTKLTQEVLTFMEETSIVRSENVLEEVTGQNILRWRLK